MLVEMVQYRIVCDVCGKGTGLHHNEFSVIADAKAVGWEGSQAFEATARDRLWRCPKCVKAGKFPGAQGGNQDANG